ncbi:heme peroxidase [Tricladium varicosporioides]|nr:heme peroxidase [Hymenoscyphus varicosporioides]
MIFSRKSIFAVIFSLDLGLSLIPQLSARANDGSDLPPLLGDLRFAQVTPIGIQIANILLGVDFGVGMSNIVGSQSSIVGSLPPGSGPGACKNSIDLCCLYYEISRELTREFRGPTGRCNDQARAAIRLGFHDAGSWSQSLANAGQDFGGADGSLAMFQEEINRPENNGLQGIIQLAQKLQKKYGVGMGDLIQYMAKHATVTCPLGPRIRTYIGRKDATRPALPGLMPDVHSNASINMALFADKTISGHDLAALLGAHTAAKQFFVDPSQRGFYAQVLLPQVPRGVFRFFSDKSVSENFFEAIEWNMFAINQTHWNNDYANAYIRLSLLGVNNINYLTECTQTLPPAQPKFSNAQDPNLDG